MSLAKTETSDTRVRLNYLDGVRGFASLYVFTYHGIMMYTIAVGERMTTFPKWFILFHRFMYYAVLNWGHYAVCVFIVLSGYCLMLPVVRDPLHRLKGGPAGYVRRRARRILPAYYGALAASILIMWLFPFLNRPGTHSWPTVIPWHEVPTRLLLVHNLIKDHWHLNAPMWSVALEWQIYFLLPALLLPSWRRWGDVGVVGMAALVAAAPCIVLPKAHNLNWASTHMVVLFAFGMTAAAVGFAPGNRYVHLRSFRWGRIAVTAMAAFVVMCAFQRKRIIESEVGGAMHLAQFYGWPADIVVGAVCAIVLIRLTEVTRNGGGLLPRLVLRLLTSRPAIVLGSCSYSLYLLHSPMIHITDRIVPVDLLPAVGGAMAYFGVLLPTTFGVVWLFHLVLERPFLGEAARTTQASIRAVSEHKRVMG